MPYRNLVRKSGCKASGETVEFVIAPGRPVDITISEQTDIALPSDSELCGDRGYNDYDYEDMPEEFDGITPEPIRKKIPNVRPIPS